MVCVECRRAGALNLSAINAFNEGRLDEYEDLKYRAEIAHQECAAKGGGCYCQHRTGLNNIIRVA